MKKYKCSFIGRKNGSIGLTYKISLVVELPKNSSLRQIIDKVYEQYEHISDFKCHNL